ncbi:MAG TPA: lipopolysaccharide biosynthesis protein [Candidatus Scybalocola faecipullorum]|nr:lipopolysaccharide biosynthesis protein [Candidatus Scybalocola faecipullorum]
MGINSKKVAMNLIWRFLERTGAQGVTFVVSIILARLLDPSTYGTVAIVTVIISLLQVFIDSGLGNALIQKKDSDYIDFSTVFYFNVAACSLMYIVLFISAPYIAMFYSMPDLTPVIRVLGITLIISGVKNIQQAYVSKKMMFKKFFFATLGGTIGSAFIGIVMAYQGFGVWALVAQNLFNNLVDTIILWLTVKWRPILKFSYSRLKKLFGFGSRLLVTDLLENLYNDISQLIIGKQYTSAQLAFYNKGKQFPYYVVTNINSSLKSVLFPVFSEAQDDLVYLKSITRKSIQLSNYLISPMIIGLAACAETFISCLLTDTWLPCVIYLRLFCICYLFQPIQTTNKNAIKALGKGEILLKIQLIVRCVGIALIILAIKWGIIAITLAVIFTNLFEQVLLATENKKLLQYGYVDQFVDMFPAIAMSLIMGTVVYWMQNIPAHSAIVLLLQVIVGFLIYLIESIFTKNNTFIYILSFLRKNKRK